MSYPVSVDDRFVGLGANGRRVTHPLLVIVLCQVFYLPILFSFLLPTVSEAAIGALGTAVGTGIAVLLQIIFMLLPYLPLLLWLRYYEGRAPFASTGLGFDRRALSGLGAGFGAAAVFVAAWILISLAAGTVRFAGFGALGVAEVSLALLGGVFMLLMRILMIGVEEQLYRGWMLQAVGSRWGVAAGVLVSSFFFALWHFYFIGQPLDFHHEPHWVLALNIFLWSVFAALWTLRARNLWPAVGFHAAALILPMFLPTVATEETAGEYPGLVLFLIEEPSYYAGGVGFAGLFEGLPATAALLALAAFAWVALYRRSTRGSGLVAARG